MEYKNAIEEAFELYDKIENEICEFQRISDSHVDVTYADGVLTIAADCRTKKYEAKVTISRDEIFDMVLKEDIEPKDAICRLLKNKICCAACEY